ncbi:MAG: ABC transporter permease, partial [Longimicrobiales bacterium]
MAESGNREDRGNREHPSWRRYLRLWLPDAARDHEDEVSFHLAMRERDLVRGGLSEEEAVREARRGFGEVHAIRRRLDEQERRRSARARRTAWVEELRGDVLIALRSFVRRPAFAAAAVGTLMLGIGATTAVFSLVHGIVLRPLPYPHPERLAVLWERNIPRAKAENVVSMSNFEVWRERSRSFVAMAALAPHRGTIVGEVPERVYGGEVTASWLDVVGVSPAIGRGFTESDVRQGSRVVVLSDGLWRERLGGDAAAVGGTLVLGSEPYTIIGVMPRAFEPPAFGWLGREQRYWVPLGPTPQNREWGRAFLVLGRLREDVSIDEADRELKTVARALEREDLRDEGWTADVVELKEQVVGNVRAALWTLMVAVAFLLALAAVNVANLVLARAQGRTGEFSLRVALGAGRGRLSRQLFAEALALAMLGAPLGVLLAFWGVRGLRSVFPADIPRAESVGLNPTVLGFAALATIGAVLLAAVLPAIRLSRARVETGLRASGGRVTPPAGAGALIVVEIALALLLTNYWLCDGLALRPFRPQAPGGWRELGRSLSIALPALLLFSIGVGASWAFGFYWSQGSAPVWQGLLSLAGYALLMAVAVPLLIRISWRFRPLPQAEADRAIQDELHANGIRGTRVYAWPEEALGGTTAAIIGLVRPFRYMLIGPT